MPSVALPLLLALEQLREDWHQTEHHAYHGAAVNEPISVCSPRVLVALWDATEAILEVTGQGESRHARRVRRDVDQLASDHDAGAEPPLRAISKVLTQLTGKQVASKAARNRRETSQQQRDLQD